MALKPNKKDSQSRLAQKSFWSSLPRPFFVIAPMANVTDVAFRSMFAKCGKPDVMWTEFVSADGLSSPGKEMLLNDLKFSENERPIVAQLFTAHPEKMRQAVELVRELGFDGVDINMGCPDRSIEKQGAGAAHMKDFETAIQVVKYAREGWEAKSPTSLHSVPSFSNGDLSNETPVVESTFQEGCARKMGDFNFSDETLEIPVSVKTRIGYNRVDLEWIQTLLELKLPALTVHLRTRKEMSDVPAHWEIMPEIVKLRDKISPKTLIIGNGDVITMEDARDKIQASGCDGAMIGRGIFGNPWFFESLNKIQNSEQQIENQLESEIQPKSRAVRDISKIKNASEKSPEVRLRVMLEHAIAFDKLLGTVKNFAIMKKHFKAYVSGWAASEARVGAKELRVKLMDCNNLDEVKRVVDLYLKSV